MVTHLGELLKEIPRRGKQGKEIEDGGLWEHWGRSCKEKGGTIVRTHCHCIKVLERAIADSPWGAFEGDTEEGRQV